MMLVKINEYQKSKFFASNTIDVHANKSQPTDKVALLEAIEQDPLSFFFCQWIKSILIF